MARRRRTYAARTPRRRTVTRYVKSRRRRKSNGGNSMKPIIDGLIAGAAGQVASKYIGNWGHPAATLGIGYFRKNTTLKTEGARELGAMLATQLPVIGGGNSPYGVY